MKLVETPEFSVEANPMFENTRVFAGSIGLRREPETTFSPQISVWTTEAEKDVSPQDWLTDTLKDNGAIIERKAVVFAGMTGEMTTIKDRLKDWDTNEERDWYRLRVLLVSDNGTAWYHATAMTSGADFPAVEADFTRLLGSIRIKLAGVAASKAREVGEDQKTALLEQMKKKIDEAAAGNREREREREKAARSARAREPVADVEVRFDKAVAASGLQDKRDVLRQIVLPTVSLTELDVVEADKTGLSRIGGGPDLPEKMDWPRDASGFYLNFLGQIELADLPERAEILPDAGLLSFFTGTDYSDWRVNYTPPGVTLVTHALPDSAIDTTESAFRMVVWNGDRKQFVADGTRIDGLSVETDDKGRMTFKRDGHAVMVFASEYEISRSAQELRLERSLSTPFGLPDTNIPKTYVDAGIKDPSGFALAIQENFKIGEGPQHQMFGISGVRELSSIQKLAADYAAKQGWSDLVMPDGWFILIKFASGGEADFSFSDHGDYIFMIHRNDAAKGDFTRVFAFVDSG
ncbi:DUF1963 domain-containing protein [Phyllobacterium sp. K27]